MNRLFNDTVIDQNIRFPNNVREVSQSAFLDGIPVLRLVPKCTLQRVGDDYRGCLYP